jgi:hypothetical protein
MKTRADLTFKHNLKNGRHGWLRLTPAYSIKVVGEILNAHPSLKLILDPFSGTGTTGLVCAELGLSCDLLDINPFLVWFAGVKTANYSFSECLEAQQVAGSIINRLVDGSSSRDLWLPPLKNIDRWWSEEKRMLLAQIRQDIDEHCPNVSPSKNLLLVAFCRIVIEWSNAAFNHQSMSFKDATQSLFDSEGRGNLLSQFDKLVREVTESAAARVEGRVKVTQADSRYVPRPSGYLYDCVITSPPYPNRMSYIRELRPYMYWLGYISEAREAGELDWQAIGGTWGIATSRVEKWQANGSRIEHEGFYEIVGKIGETSKVLANYVHKYFVDALSHLHSVYQTLAPEGRVFYVVGNSKFYDTLVPVHEIYASLLEQCGFKDIQIDILRKRNSKKELLEMLVSARKS